MKSTIAVETISTLLVLLFASTATSKIIDPVPFAIALRSSPLLSWGAGMLAWMVPLTELCVALLLLFRSTRLKGLYFSIILLLLFSLYILYMLVALPSLPCRCGGIISTLSWPGHLLVNLFLVTLTWYSIHHQHKIRKLSPPHIIHA